MNDRVGVTPSPVEVFCSYAHEDEVFRDQLLTHLEHLKRQEVISVWDDRCIQPGGLWDHQIKQRVESADIFLFLISADFIGSRYAYEDEVLRALERRADGVDIFPILVRDVDWEGSPFSDLQALPIDDRGRFRPVSRWGHRDAAYAYVAKKIRERAVERAQAAQRPNADAGTGGKDNGGASPGFWNVAEPGASPLVGRDGLLAELSSELTSSETSNVVALVGAGGVGKSVLAAEYAARERKHYDFVAWLHAANTEQLQWEYATLAGKVGLATTGQAEAQAAFRKWLEGHGRWLLVFDNMHNPGDIHGYLPKQMQGHAIVTTRKGGWEAIAGEIRVDPLAPDDAVALLVSQSGNTDGQGARKLAERLRCVPKALEQAAATIREEGLSYADWTELSKASSEPS